MNNAYNYGYIYFLKLLRKDEYVAIPTQIFLKYSKSIS